MIEFLSGHNLQVHLISGDLKIVRAYEECSFGFKQEIVSFLTRLISAGTITLSNGDKLVTEVSEDIPSDMNETVFVAKYNDISYPIRIRSRENGDRMSIQGMNGTKKIKAIFIEAKVPREKEKNGRSFVMQVGILFGYPC